MSSKIGQICLDINLYGLINKLVRVNESNFSTQREDNNYAGTKWKILKLNTESITTMELTLN